MVKKLRIGRHINVSKGFVTAPAYAKKLGCDVFQVFLGSPQQIISKPRSLSELKEFSTELAKHKLKMVIHSSYTINMCHPSTKNLFKTSVKSLVQDLNSANIIGSRCIGVIIHMGKNVETNHIPVPDAMQNYVNGIKEAIKKTPPDTTIILETGASQGTEVGSRLEPLSEIYHSFTENEKERIKFCIDTCHIWASGYDISNKEKVDTFFERFDELIGVDKIACIHFNNSKSQLNSHVDRHADLDFGMIPLDGIIAFSRKAKEYHIPLIMETPLESINPKTNREVTTEEELIKVRKWIKS